MFKICLMRRDGVPNVGDYFVTKRKVECRVVKTNAKRVYYIEIDEYQKNALRRNWQNKADEWYYTLKSFVKKTNSGEFTIKPESEIKSKVLKKFKIPENGEIQNKG